MIHESTFSGDYNLGQFRNENEQGKHYFSLPLDIWQRTHMSIGETNILVPCGYCFVICSEEHQHWVHFFFFTIYVIILLLLEMWTICNDKVSTPIHFQFCIGYSIQQLNREKDLKCEFSSLILFLNSMFLLLL